MRLARRIYWYLINMLTVVGLIGLGWYTWLVVTSPATPNLMLGLVYKVPAEGGGVYVNQTNALVLWAFVGEISMLVVVGAFGRMFGPPQYFKIFPRFRPSSNGR